MGTVSRNCRKMNSPVLCYTPEEIIEFQNHISNSVGPCGDIVLPDKKNRFGIHIDIVVVWPRPEDPYIHLITIGAGAYSMPGGKRAEYMITLPKEWPMDVKSWRDERNFWPIRLLQNASRFPIGASTKLNWFHVLTFEGPFSVDTLQCGCIFMPLPFFKKVQLSSGKVVKILQIVPLYQREIDQCYNLGNKQVASAIKAIFAGVYCFPVSPQRALCL